MIAEDDFREDLMFRLNVSALGNRLVAPLSGWDLDMSSLPDWHRV
jgi:transcriptional regulator with PAS, ATPase and Fis domain